MQNKTKHYQVQEGLLEAETFLMCLFDLHSIITSLANNLRIQFLPTSWVTIRLISILDKRSIYAAWEKIEWQNYTVSISPSMDICASAYGYSWPSLCMSLYMSVNLLNYFCLSISWTTRVYYPSRFYIFVQHRFSFTFSRNIRQWQRRFSRNMALVLQVECSSNQRK